MFGMQVKTSNQDYVYSDITDEYGFFSSSSLNSATLNGTIQPYNEEESTNITDPQIKILDQTNSTMTKLAETLSAIHLQPTNAAVANSAVIMTSLELTKKIWRNADAVCFDVDSTVCCDEAIDELAKYVGKSQEVSDITKTAMHGGADFRTALARRLAIIKPSTKILQQYLSSHEPRLTPYIEELVALLHKRGVDAYLVSGGFDTIIQATAEKLNIPLENIFANRINFYHDGSYKGFDETRPTSSQDGKPRVIAMLKQSKGYKSIVMIGDGVTDLEACPPADAFIGFGGNQVRETVRNSASWFVYSFKELIAEL